MSKQIIATLATFETWHRTTGVFCLTLDDLAYVSKDQAETSSLFALISARHERRSMLITANQPFDE